MKRTVQILIVMLLFSANYANAQPFTAKSGFSKAKEEAHNSGYANPQLLGIGTSPGKYDTGQIPFTIEFNFDNGKADGWAYMFRSSEDTTDKIAIGVTKIIGYLAFGMPMDQLGDLPSMTRKEIEIDKVMDSDEMAENLSKNNKFNSYMDANEDAELDVVGCFKNTSNPLFELGTVFWMLNLRSDNGLLICAVHAETGETQCNSVTSVAEKPGGSLHNPLYPNPADNFIKIRIAEEIFKKDINISVYDLNGREQLHYDSVFDASDGDFLMIPVESLSTGYYYLVIESDGDMVSKPFVVRR